MNESENLLIIALTQLGCISKDTEIRTLNQVTSDEYAKILLKICKKISSLKELEIDLPETLSRDLTSRYRECQKLVEFIKKIGYKGDLNLNNILYPSSKDMQRIFEFTMEYVTNVDTGALEYEQNISDKKFMKIKISKTMNNWVKDHWILPELNQSKNSKNRQKTQLLFLDKHGLNLKRKSFKNVEIPNNSIIIVFILVEIISQNRAEELFASDSLNILTEDDYKTGYNKKSDHSEIILSLNNKNRSNNDKTSNQQFLDLITLRNVAFDCIKDRFHENNYVNNVKILEHKNRKIFKRDFNTNADNKIINLTESIITENESGFTDSTKDSSIQPKQNIYQSKIDSLMVNYEKEREIKNNEIKELSLTLQNILSSIEQQSSLINDKKETKKELEITIRDLGILNENIIKNVEEKLETFEQIQKLNNSEIQEKDLNQEVLTLENKYDEMISNWEEYSSEAKTRIEELKSTIEVKKKEYNFKYDKISSLKKEIEEISSKITLKQELAAFLNEEYQKIPVDINRNKFITKISELTQSIVQEKNFISKYHNELKQCENQIVIMNENIKKVDNELEEKLYQDAKTTSSLKDVYAQFINIRDGYNNIQKNIIDMQIVKNKIKELENKVDDYNQKLKSYDINQLKEQVDYLKLENAKTFK